MDEPHQSIAVMPSAIRYAHIHGMNNVNGKKRSGKPTEPMGTLGLYQFASAGQLFNMYAV
jgi:hypothetical protein